MAIQLHQSFTHAMIILALIVMSSCSLGVAPDGAPSDSSSPIPLILGIQTAPVAAVPIIAYERGYFKEEGLDVDLQEFTAGKFALQALLSGSVDMATPAEVPPTLALLQGHSGKFVIIAQGVKSTDGEVRMVVRSDSTSDSPNDYFTSKKRRIATSFGGGPEFFTYDFLNRYNISRDNVDLLNLKPEDMPAALSSGSVDAVAIFEPFAYFAENLTKGSVSFHDDSLYSELYVFAVSTAFMEKSPPDAPDRILRALIKSENFIADDPEGSKDIVSRYTHLDRGVLDAIWDSFEFKVVLGSSLVDYMAREATWARDTGKVPNDAVLPEASVFIDSAPLIRVRPASVSLD
ncbi:MAG: NrtA/SsuA/CpmA family ABC transporter substrate-binding protein [Nanoarchaeota archaeon]